MAFINPSSGGKLSERKGKNPWHRFKSLYPGDGLWPAVFISCQSLPEITVQNITLILYNYLSLRLLDAGTLVAF